MVHNMLQLSSHETLSIQNVDSGSACSFASETGIASLKYFQHFVVYAGLHTPLLLPYKVTYLLQTA